MFRIGRCTDRWGRVAEFVAGCLLKAVGRKLLRIALLHYVDDYFGGDRASCIQSAKDSFARLVRCCLGESAIADRKLEHGNPLEILGVETLLREEGLYYWPAPDKVIKWKEVIRVARATKMLPAGSASKLTGKLSWGTQHSFKRIGRGMLRPLILHTKTGLPEISDETDLGLAWWEEILELELK